MTVPTILVDRRNFDQIKPQIIAEMSAASFIGYDIETQDVARHPGLTEYMGGGKRLVFDTRRTTVTGFSIYPDKAEHSYYINLAHADVENRVSWEDARTLLDAKPAMSYWIAHNLPFELVMMENSLNYNLWPRAICTLQLAVSLYGPDEYDLNRLREPGLGAIGGLMQQVAQVFGGYQQGMEMTPEQADLFSKVTAKESDAAHSYNGYTKELSWGYGLKKAVKQWFGYEMRTFEQTLGDKAHMGELTGEEVAAYGGDDAYWAVRLYHRLIEFAMQTNPGVLKTYYTQELPMVRVYADVWKGGLKVNTQAITRRRAEERVHTATVLRQLRTAVNALLPFPDGPHESLLKRDSWYTKNWTKYRQSVEHWARLPEEPDAYEEVKRISGAVSNAWAKEEEGIKKLTGPNVTHYMTMRTLIYDLTNQKLFVEHGKTQSDAEARGRLIIRIEKQMKEEGADLERLQASIDLLTAITEMAGIEQRMKLYLTPYSQLMDPETGRMYPVLSSKLAARRMATSFPNPMQLAKRGESTYVRGFFEADEPDHLVYGRDWSSVELVEIGDFSGDPEFAKAFSQIPYEDLHAGAAADVLGIAEEIFADLKKADFDISKVNTRWLNNLKGEAMEPSKAYKYWRTEVGKGANFNYWYSGALSTIGQKLGWQPEQMWEATDRYRTRFAVAEEWRLNLINEAVMNGFVTLPDGHRRVRYECTQEWANLMRSKFKAYGNDAIYAFAEAMIKRIQSRAKNQIVNAMIQGSCSTLAKRSIIRINDMIERTKLRARFMIPIHDELVSSVHKDDVIAFGHESGQIMTDHPDIIKTLKLHSTAALGRTFEPFHQQKVPFGQIELDEAPEVSWLPKEFHGKSLPDAQVQTVIDYLMEAPGYRMAA